MEFRDLKQQYRVLKEDLDRAVLDTMASGAFIMGPAVKALEAELAAYVGVKHCLTCANGTDALTLALKAWGVGPGDAVFVPDFTFFSTAEVVSLEGATPVFVDVCEDTFNMDAENLERAIREVLSEGRLTPRAVIAVDLFGLPADYPAIRTVTNRYGLKLLEDGAQGFGGQMADQVGHDDRVVPGTPSSVNPGRPSSVMPDLIGHLSRACSFGDIATTSFFPAKPLGCYGDGGAVFTDNDEWAALIDSYRVHGKGTFKYDNVRIGLNSRLDTVQAAILRVKLKAFADYELDAVNKAASAYTERLEGLATPVIPAGFRSSWAQYTVRFENHEQRDAVQSALKAAGIPAMVYYPKPMHLQTAFRCPVKPGMTSGSAKPGMTSGNVESVNVMPDLIGHLCPVATSLCSRVLSLPMHPYITVKEIDTVCATIRRALAR